jgi:hypothetical protein
MLQPDHAVGQARRDMFQRGSGMLKVLSSEDLSLPRRKPIIINWSYTIFGNSVNGIARVVSRIPVIFTVPYISVPFGSG